MKKKFMEETEPQYVNVDDFANHLNLKKLYVGNIENIKLCSVSVNRPGLLLAGFENYFGDNRVQVMGSAELEYLNTLGKEKAEEVLTRLFEREIPCLIICRDIKPPKIMLDLARNFNRAVFASDDITSNVINELSIYLNDILAPTTSIHGVLLDVYGVGVLLSGASGIGKSETALEMVKRGHRLVADDMVMIKNVKNRIFGTAPDVIRFFMEIRGIGIIDVKNMYGVGSVLYEKEVELVLELEKWDNDKQYERLGKDEQYFEMLGVSIPKITIPVRPGRNLAIIAEVAARNYRLKKSGYNAAVEIDKKLFSD